VGKKCTQTENTRKHKLKGLYRSVKKYLAILLALTMTIAVCAGCSGQNAESSGESSEPFTDELLTESSGSDEIMRPSFSEASASNKLKDESEITLVQLQAPKAGDRIVTMETSLGAIKFVVYPDKAPKAAENFLTLAETDFYNGKVFHFAEDGFMIQGGAVNSNGTGSRSAFTNAQGEQEYFETEPSWDLWHFRGAVSLANTSENLNGSQFVIVQADSIYGHTEQELEDAAFPRKVIDQYVERGGIPHRDTYSTVFGMVVSGMDVVDDIASIETDASGAPLERVVIEVVTVDTLDEAGAAELAAAMAAGSTSGEDTSEADTSSSSAA